MIVKIQQRLLLGIWVSLCKNSWRIQIDLYNYFRKNENLPAYKLDYVASHFIGDIVKDYEVKEKNKDIKNLID